MITVVLALVGTFFGAALADEEGMIFGLLIGLAFGLIFSLKDRVAKLEQEVRRLSSTVDSSVISSKGVSDKAEVTAPQPATEFTAQGPQPAKAPVSWDALVEIKDTLTANETVDSKPSVEPSNFTPSNNQSKTTQPKFSEPDFAEKLFFMVRDFFTTGNVVVKVGAIILFFGVSFLLKYAAERSMFPIELRLVGVIVAGIVMLGLGWRLRSTKHEYGLILQGAGIGILYLTLFATAKFYQLIPMGFTLMMMLALVVMTGWLAVKQDAKSLAIFGSVGGFLAPILMSTGSGSHIMLFSYYTLLNVGIFGIAWFKSWRFLNLVGFIFTFLISSLWGYKAYQAEFFVSTEAFLILFYLLFLTISVLFAFKQPPKLKGYVDGTLIFGLPLIAFALQSELVRHFEYGQAITAASMGAIYLILARSLWRLNHGSFKLLSESFLALGIGFASLAIPLYFDGRWTAAVWAVEGAGLVWIGLRQSNFIPRAFGLILTVAASISFIESIDGHLAESLPVINSFYLGMVLISMAALFIAYLYEKTATKVYSFESTISGDWFIIAGLVFWFVAGLVEIEHFSSSPYEWKLSLIFIAVTTFIQAVISYKLNWEKVSLSAVLFMPAVVFIITGLMFEELFASDAANPFSHLGFLAWPAALLVHLLVLSRNESNWPKQILTVWHAAGVWIVAFISLWTVVDVVDRLIAIDRTWVISSAGLILAAISGTLIYFGKKSSWPISQHQHAYYVWGILPLMLILFLWQFVSSTEAGDPVIFGYLPIINPLDISQAIVITVMVYWLRFICQLSRSPIVFPTKTIALIAGMMSFSWINIVIARTVHAFADIPYDQSDMVASGLFQVSTSIIWSGLAIILMVAALKKSSRSYWFAGAGLLALVVLKLFFIDLAESGSISRIISFLVVGGLMLLVGYFSPLPPKKVLVSNSMGQAS